MVLNGLKYPVAMHRLFLLDKHDSQMSFEDYVFLFHPNHYLGQLLVKYRKPLPW